MEDWAQLQGQADEHYDLEDLKARADLVIVCDELGIELEEQGERWVGQCPFHVDTNPSFSVWYEDERGADRAGCWSCDFGTGDVFDVVRRRLTLSFPDAARWVKEFVDSKGDVKRPESSSQGHDVDLAAIARSAVRDAQTGTDDVLTRYLADRDVRVPASWLTQEFWVGAHDDLNRVVIPHLTPDAREVTGVKYRYAPDWEKRAETGSKLKHLYGDWRSRDRQRVIVCEGESDTWTVAYELRNHDVDVIGLPSGATHKVRPEWRERLKNHEITLMFDADDVGRDAARSWVKTFGQLRIASLHEGQDASAVSSDQLHYALQTARSVSSYTDPGIIEQNGWMFRNTEAATPVANFTLTLRRAIAFENEGYVFEVELPDTRVVQLTTTDLNTAPSITRWANRYGYSWYGTNKDVQELLRILMDEAPFRPQVAGTHVAGWHEDGFVFPAPLRTVGADEKVVYVPPVADVRIDERLYLRNADWSPDVPSLLYSLHLPKVITPIIGWVAAAPLRSMVRKFPILSVVGGAGYGKTTVIQEVLRTFGFGGDPMVLTASTPHAVHSLASSTNSIPAWFDEYRAGARADSKIVLEQVIRDAWDGSSSAKGGLQDNRQALTYLPAVAPIIVTGEDVFSETSHLERMVMIPIPRAGRSAEALQRLQNEERDGFGYAYLEWLAESHRRGTLPAPPDVADRMQHSRAVTSWGWELLSTFVRDVLRKEVPDVDESLVKSVHDEATSRPVVIELLSEFISRHDHEGRQIVWLDGDDVCVRLQELVKGAERYTDIKLPGGSRSIKQWLESEYHCENVRGTDGRFLQVRGARERVIQSD